MKRFVGFISALAACASTSAVTVDPALTKDAERANAKAEPGKEIVIRVTDGERTWSVVVPSGVEGYELAIPTSPKDARVAGVQGGATAKRASADIGAAVRPTDDVEITAYLRGIARVRELRESNNKELATLEAMSLARRHPKRARVWAMLGTLHAELGQRKEAREAWRKAIEIDPRDTVTAEALEKLEKE
ncbi:MAG: tetratricopeptide repeat protein [Deltaproteobacteria bacterium]|nr:tetratricopeptide repeat protein [Deltaproteobacteria bacterium]